MWVGVDPGQQTPPTCPSLPTVGVSLPDTTALSASPFGPWLWYH